MLPFALGLDLDPSVGIGAELVANGNDGGAEVAQIGSQRLRPTAPPGLQLEGGCVWSPLSLASNGEGGALRAEVVRLTEELRSPMAAATGVQSCVARVLYSWASPPH